MSKRWFFLVASTSLLFACQNNTVQESSVQSSPQQISGKPEWVTHYSVKEGLVCSQDKGVYSKEKAFNAAINSCLVQLAEKQIQGQSQEKREIHVTKKNDVEQVTTYGESNSEFVVETAGSKQLSYEVLGKYYDPVVEKAYVWVKLK